MVRDWLDPGEKFTTFFPLGLFCEFFGDTFCHMPNIKLALYMWKILFHVRLYTDMAICGDYFYVGSSVMNILHTPFEPLPFHCIAAGHLTNLNNLKVNYLVTELIDHGVCPIFSTVSGTVTSTISRQPQVFNFKLTENRILLCLPSLINYKK